MPWDDPHHERPQPAGAEVVFGIATLLLGAALGAATAILLTPARGQDLRMRIADSAGNWKVHLAEALAQGRESVVSAVEQAHGAAPSHPPGAVKPV